MSGEPVEFSRESVRALVCAEEETKKIPKWLNELGRSIREDAVVKSIDETAFEDYLSCPEIEYGELAVLARAAVDSINHGATMISPLCCTVSDGYGNSTELNVGLFLNDSISNVVKHIAREAKAFADSR